MSEIDVDDMLDAALDAVHDDGPATSSNAAGGGAGAGGSPEAKMPGGIPAMMSPAGMPGGMPMGMNNPMMQMMSGSGNANANPMHQMMQMSPAMVAQMADKMTPEQMQQMRQRMQQMNPSTMQQMRQQVMAMTPEQRLQMQMQMQKQMQAMSKQLTPTEVEMLQRQAKSQAKMVVDGGPAGAAGSGGGGSAAAAAAAATAKPAAGHGHSHAAPQQQHGHSHGGRECNHNHGGGYGAPSYASLQRHAASDVIKAARADLNRPFVKKQSVLFECPKCSHEGQATYPMVVHTVKCNKCGQFISLPPFNPLPRDKAICNPNLLEPLKLDTAKRHMDKNLFQYIELGEFFEFEKCIQRGATPQIRLPDNDNPNTLHWAVAQFSGDMRFVETLVRHPDMEVDSKTGKHGQTALHIAAYYGATSVAQLLVAGRANIHLVDNSNWTVIHQAAKSGNTFLIDVFHRGGVSLHAKDKHARTALHWAAYHNRMETATWLLEHGLDIMERDVEQCIPLHWATLQGHMTMINLLIRHSHAQEQLEAKDETGEDAQGLAADKQLRMQEQQKQTLYLHVAKTVRGFDTEMKWRRRLLCLSRKPGAGLPDMKADSFLFFMFVVELGSVCYVYFTQVFWLTSHLTVPTMLFNLLLLATAVVWIRARYSDPGYIVGPAAGGPAAADGEDKEKASSSSSSTTTTVTTRRDLTPSLPAQFKVLRRLYDDSLKCVPRAYGRVDAREGIIIPNRAKRCPISDRVVLNYHNYCPWLGMPVGLRNIRIVTVFTLLVLLLDLVWIGLGWYYIAHTTPPDSTVYQTHTYFVFWLAHFVGFAMSAMQTLLPIANAAFTNVTPSEFQNPTAHPYLIVKSNQHGPAWNNPFDKGIKSNIARWVTGANIEDVPLPPLSCSAAPEEV